jgi:type I restriction enzyme S subunit
MSWGKVYFREILSFLPKSKLLASKGSVEGNYKFFTSSPIQKKWIDTAIFNTQALVFGSGGSSSIHYVEGMFSTSTDCFVAELRDRENIYLKYVYHFISSNMHILEEGFKGAGLKHISKAYIENLEIPLPPLSEQKCIAAILDKASKIKAKREQAIAKLDELASTTFDEMYDTLDSVYTKSLGEILELQRGASPRPISDWITEGEDGVNWIKIADATASDKYIFKCKEKIKKQAVAMTRYVKSGDFLLSNSMSFGRPYILKTDGCIHDGWLLIRDTKNIFEQDYLYAVLSCRSIKEQFKKLATGAVVKNLNIDAVSKVKVKIPKKEIQKKFSEKIHELEANKANHVKQLTVISSLISSLQHQSFGLK